MKRVQFCNKVQIYQPVGTNTLLRTGPLVDHSTRLDKIVKQYEIGCAHASSFLDIRKANTNVIEAINGLPGRKTITEWIVKRIFQTIYE